jgi:hypothetical protein
MFDAAAPTFGLPECLRVPIAAASVDAIDKYVGTVVRSLSTRGASVALLVEPYSRDLCIEGCVALWVQPEAALYRDRLHRARQVWVHVDYQGYRRAYKRFGMAPIPEGDVLDHIQNRKAIRLREYSHPFLRLCPVSSAVNTSGGVATGGEGMEKEYLQSFNADREQYRVRISLATNQIIYADPMDLTKMLNVAPGTGTLPGVRDTQAHFYPNRNS